MPKYKKRPDGRYEAKVNVGLSPDGSYKRKAVYAKTIVELEDKIREIKNQSDLGVDLMSKKPTVKEWADKWLEVYKPDIGRSMRTNYSGIIGKWRLPIHNVSIDKVRQVKLQEVLLTASKSLSQSSIDKMHNV